MNNRALTLSVLMGLIATYFVYSYVSSIETEARRTYGTEFTVIKAKKDIKEMETINVTHLQLDTVPKHFLEPAAIYFEKKEDDSDNKVPMKTMNDLAGAVALVPIKKGQQISRNQITEPSIRTGLAPQVAPGHRAVTVMVNETTSVAKLVKPGDRVDLLAVLDMGSGKETKLARTILQDVVILAVGRSVTQNVPRVVEADSDGGGKTKIRTLTEDFSFSSVTLEVEPVQAQILALITANSDNTLSLSLRNNDDTDRVSVPSFTLYDILGPDAARMRMPAGGNKR